MKIVIVDDNPVNVVVVKSLVKQLPDCESVEFTDPLQAIDWCLVNDPDLVVVDYMMPALDGLAFIKMFRAYPGKEEIPVLMVTASHESAIRYEALAVGANDFLTKPIDRVEFLARSRNMLALRKGQVALAYRAELLAEDVYQATHSSAEVERDTMSRMAGWAERGDPFLGRHIERVCHYARHIARKLRLPAEEQKALFEAAALHDVGKLFMPDALCAHPGVFSAEQRAVMQRHTVDGFEMLRTSPSQNLRLAALIAHSHHERFDGGGYPQGLAGAAIPLVGRIVAVADVFDALTSERAHRPARPVDEALAHLHAHAGSHFDPDCVAAFAQEWDAVLDIRAQHGDAPALAVAEVEAADRG
jgi:putative two-component system response regulator